MRIRWINRPANQYTNLDGAIYEQITPFQPVERDWNNDGDIYTEIVSVFELIADENPARDPFRQPPKRQILNKWEWVDMLDGGYIEILPE